MAFETAPELDEPAWAPPRPGPDEGRDVAARLAYDPKITTVAIIDGGERHLFNQPLLSGLPTCKPGAHFGDLAPLGRSEEHTSELQSLMRISYAVFCLKKQIQISECHFTTQSAGAGGEGGNNS